MRHLSQASDNQLLVRVFSEQAVREDGSIRLKTKEDGMGSDIIQNPADPDATYREKAGKQHRGYADKENNGFRTVRGTCHDFVLYREHPACFCGNSGRKTGTAKYGDRAAALPDGGKRGGLRQYTPHSAFRIFVW